MKLLNILKFGVAVAMIVAIGYFIAPEGAGTQPDASAPAQTIEEAQDQKLQPKEISQSELEVLAKSGQLVDVHILNGSNTASTYVLALTKDGQYLTASLVPYSVDTLLDLLRANDVPFDNVAYKASFAEMLFGNFFMILLFAVLIYFLIKRFSKPKDGNSKVKRKDKNKGESVFSMGAPTSPADEVDVTKCRLSDVGGLAPVLADLQTAAEKIAFPEKAGQLGSKPAKGVILTGEPGGGKTLLARAFADEVNALIKAHNQQLGIKHENITFLTVSASSFMELYVGKGAQNIRALFADASAHAPCILFIDEIDAIGSRDSGEEGGGGSERKQTLNALLTEMDGAKELKDVFVIAATNRVGDVDPALLRPGRFNLVIDIPKPNLAGRQEILAIHAKKQELRAFTHIQNHVDSSVSRETFTIFDEKVSFEQIARETANFSGAQLEELLRMAAEIAENDARQLPEENDVYNHKITMRHLSRGIDKVKASSALASTGAKSKTNAARIADAEIPDLTLEDVGGIKHLKPQLYKVVEQLQNLSTSGILGDNVPRGFLLAGPPGTGKTLMAKALAGELNRNTLENGGEPVRFLHTSASSFVEKYVGVGAARVRDLFEQARKSSPCIIFIDEADSLGNRKKLGNDGNSEAKNTINEMLAQMDGFSNNDRIIVMMATNDIENIDEAIRRPGRIDRTITVPLPDMEGRREILDIHVKRLTEKAIQLRQASDFEGLADNMENFSIFSDHVNLDQVARETMNMSGAQLANLLETAAEKAVMEAKALYASSQDAGKLVNQRIEMHHIRDALQSQAIGEERPTKRGLREDFLIAVHEIVGHASVGNYMLKHNGADHADDIQTVTIVPRGQAAGAVWFTPSEDMSGKSKRYYEGRLSIAAAGRIAEALFLGPEAITPGASSDIEGATQVATAMITQWGMGKKLTFRGYRSQEGYSVHHAKQDDVDGEIDELIAHHYNRAEAIILSYGEDILKHLTKVMLVKRTLSGEEFMNILAGKDVFNKKELDLGEQEAAFEDLWKSQAGYRAERLAIAKEDFPEIFKHA